MNKVKRMFDNDALYLWQKVWLYSAGSRGRVVSYISMCIVANLINLVEPFIVAVLLSKLVSYIGEPMTWSKVLDLFPWVVCLFLRVGLFWCFHGPSRVMEMKNAELVKRNYQTYMINGVEHLPMSWHTANHSSHTQDVISRASDYLFTFAAQTFQIFSTLLLLVVALGVILYLSPISFVIDVVLVAVLFKVLARFDRVLAPQFQQLHLAESKVAEKAFDTISNITTIKLLQWEKAGLSRVVKAMLEPVGLYRKNVKTNEIKWAVAALGGAFMVILTLLSYLVTLVLRVASPTFITFYQLLGYSSRNRDVFFNFAELYNSFMIKTAAIRNADKIANEFKESEECQCSQMISGKWKKLEINKLCFSYHGPDGDQHLQDVDLSIYRGKRYAFIGNSGSGKTTTLKLMSKLYDANYVEVSVDGIKLSHGFADIRSQVVMIPQTAEIFRASVRKNIDFEEQYDSETILRFCESARFMEVLGKTVEGLEAKIGERGLTLSGGENQRLSVARGLVASIGREIILLDESTSNLDPTNEEDVWNNIFSDFSGKTMIAVLHGWHLLPKFDEIYYFEDGKVLAHGSFDEMLENCTPFKEMWNNQNPQNSSTTRLDDMRIPEGVM